MHRILRIAVRTKMTQVETDVQAPYVQKLCPYCKKE